MFVRSATDVSGQDIIPSKINFIMMKKRLIKIITLILVQFQLVAQMADFSVLTPELEGTLRLGIINNNESLWLTELKNVQVKKNGHETIYTIKHEWLKGGVLKIYQRSLIDTKGFIIKIEQTVLPAEIKLFWAYGGCLGETVSPVKNENLLKPEFCKNNVFSIEGNSFTVYYGSSRRLRIFEALVPPSSVIRLSDANKQQSPLSLFNSGKKTDAPALSATFEIENNSEIYFCFYRQNPKADYNYFMLPKLYKTGSYEVHPESQWMKSTPD